MTNIQEGGNILPDLVNLGMPLGLSIFANNLNSSDKDKEKDTTKKNKNQKGGDILSNNLLLELGLSVVPFGLIALSEKDSNKSTNPKKKDPKSKNKKSNKL